MGGDYEVGFSYRQKQSPRQIADRAFTAELKNFFRTKDRSHLVAAYRTMLKESSANGFIDKIHKHTGINGAAKELTDYELEAKFAINLERKHNPQLAEFKIPVQTPQIIEIANAFDFQPTSNAMFLQDTAYAVSVGTNHFYGTSEGEERLCIIEKGGQTFKKEKGILEPYSFGIPFEEYILKRSETRIPTTPKDVAKAMVRLNSDGKLKDVGAVKKEKLDFFLINTTSGREYGCTVSKAERETDSSAIQHQLEIEYAGYVPGFPSIEVGNEQHIVREISQLYRLFLLGYGVAPVPLSGGWSMQLVPTKERKFDFASGKPQSSKPESLERKLGIGQIKLLTQ